MGERVGLVSPFAFLAGFGLAIMGATAPLESLVGPEAKLLNRVNELRMSRHLKPMRGHSPLAEVALAHAHEMAEAGYLSHTNVRGLNPLERVQHAGVEGFRLLAENIGASSVSGDRLTEIVDEWLRSPVHRENLLNPAFNTTGIGIAQASDGRTVVVQLYATF